MDWRIESSDVSYMAQTIGDKTSLCPLKNSAYFIAPIPMHLVGGEPTLSGSQPMEILHFYRDLTEQSGFELETAGVLKGGKKFWALARTGQSSALKKMSVMAIFYWQPPVMAHWPPRHSSPVFEWCVTTLWQSLYVDSKGIQVWKVHSIRCGT
jgi:hypothetical protein